MTKRLRCASNLYFFPANSFSAPAWNCVPENTLVPELSGCEEYCGPTFATDDVALYERNFGLKCGSDYFSHNDTTFKGCDTITTGVGSEDFFARPEDEQPPPPPPQDDDQGGSKKNKSTKSRTAVGLGVGIAGAGIVLAFVAYLYTRPRKEGAVTPSEVKNKIKHADEEKVSTV